MRKPRFTGWNTRNIPRDVLALGFVSMFTDTSSELVHSLLPVFVTSILGASVVTLGFLEGVAEATAAVMKVFSGTISDYFRKRKILVVIGYGLSALTKPVFPLATTIAWVFGARFADRVGKGIRGAPRDALIADITPPAIRGAAFGLRQSLDSVGAFLGPLLALLFMTVLANDITLVLWVAVAPAFLAVLLLVSAVREPACAGVSSGPSRRVHLRDARRLPLRYWLVVVLGFVFTLARFSEAFLILRAKDVGLAVGHVPMVLIVMNLVYSAGAYPAGAAADKFRARTLLFFGLLVLTASDIVLAAAVSPWVVFAGAALWGLHMAFTQGLMAKLVADTAPADLRGSAFGIFNLASGLALLPASVIAGTLWEVFGAPATFAAGAIFACVAATGLLFHRRPG